jgi:hypothetical protein
MVMANMERRTRSPPPVHFKACSKSWKRPQTTDEGLLSGVMIDSPEIAGRRTCAAQRDRPLPLRCRQSLQHSRMTGDGRSRVLAARHKAVTDRKAVRLTVAVGPVADFQPRRKPSRVANSKAEAQRGAMPE